jgi:hypothetical protein
MGLSLELDKAVLFERLEHSVDVVKAQDSVPTRVALERRTAKLRSGTFMRR